MDNNIFKFVIFSGQKETMESIAKRGVRALNRKTMRYRRIDKGVKYDIQEHGFIWYLMCDQDLRQIAKNQNCIL